LEDSVGEKSTTRSLDSSPSSPGETSSNSPHSPRPVSTSPTPNPSQGTRRVENQLSPRNSEHLVFKVTQDHSYAICTRPCEVTPRDSVCVPYIPPGDPSPHQLEHLLIASPLRVVVSRDPNQQEPLPLGGGHPENLTTRVKFRCLRHRYVFSPISTNPDNSHLARHGPESAPNPWEWH